MPDLFSWTMQTANNTKPNWGDVAFDGAAGWKRYNRLFDGGSLDDSDNGTPHAYNGAGGSAPGASVVTVAGGTKALKLLAGSGTKFFHTFAGSQVHLHPMIWSEVTIEAPQNGASDTGVRNRVGPVVYNSGFTSFCAGVWDYSTQHVDIFFGAGGSSSTTFSVDYSAAGLTYPIRIGLWIVGARYVHGYIKDSSGTADDLFDKADPHASMDAELLLVSDTLKTGIYLEQTAGAAVYVSRVRSSVLGCLGKVAFRPVRSGDGNNSLIFNSASGSPPTQMLVSYTSYAPVLNVQGTHARHDIGWLNMITGVIDQVLMTQVTRRAASNRTDTTSLRLMGEADGCFVYAYNSGSPSSSVLTGYAIRAADLDSGAIITPCYFNQWTGDLFSGPVGVVIT